jgi:hypothetical protein
MTRSTVVPSIRPTGLPTVVRAAVAATATAMLLLAAAGPALAHAGEDSHSHGGLTGFEDAVFLDPIIWDGESTVDCRIAGEGTIVWTLTGSEGVEYAELHIDEPERSIVRRTGGPYVWVSPLYPLDEIEADVDRIVGELADDAAFTAVTCPEGGVEEAAAAPSAAPVATPAATEAAAGPSDDGSAGLLLPVGGGVLAGAVLGLLVGSRRRSTTSA